MDNETIISLWQCVTSTDVCRLLSCEECRKLYKRNSCPAHIADHPARLEFVRSVNAKLKQRIAENEDYQLSEDDFVSILLS